MERVQQRPAVPGGDPAVRHVVAPGVDRGLAAARRPNERDVREVDRHAHAQLRVVQPRGRLVQRRDVVGVRLFRLAVIQVRLRALAEQQVTRRERVRHVGVELPGVHDALDAHPNVVHRGRHAVPRPVLVLRREGDAAPDVRAEGEQVAEQQARDGELAARDVPQEERRAGVELHLFGVRPHRVVREARPQHEEVRVLLHV